MLLCYIGAEKNLKITTDSECKHQNKCPVLMNYEVNLDFKKMSLILHTTSLLIHLKMPLSLSL